MVSCISPFAYGKETRSYENAGHRQNGPNRVRTTLSAGSQDVTSCYVKFRPTFLGPSDHSATIIEFKQIEFFDLTGKTCSAPRSLDSGARWSAAKCGPNRLFPGPIICIASLALQAPSTAKPDSLRPCFTHFRKVSSSSTCRMRIRLFGKFCRHLGNGRQKRIPLVGFNQDGGDQCPGLRLQLTEERLLLALGQVAGDDNDFEPGRTRIQG